MHDNKDKAIYLKISKGRYFSLACFQSWLNLAAIYDARLYIMCEKTDLIEAISKNCIFGSRVIGEYSQIREQQNDPLFIGAYFDRLTNLAKKALVPRWVNPGISHMTCFYHARENGFKSFWNIDADDTMFYTPTGYELKEALNKVECLDLHYDCISLDMWNSLHQGNQWSFGVAYFKMNIPWEEIIEKNVDRCHQIWDRINLSKDVYNIDYFITALQLENIVIGYTFFIENATFCHFFDRKFKTDPDQILNYWSNKTIYFPRVDMSHPIPASAIDINIDGSYLPLPNIMPISPIVLDNNFASLRGISIRQLNSILKLENDNYIYTYHNTFISYDEGKNYFYHGNKINEHINFLIENDRIALIFNNKYINFDSGLRKFYIAKDVHFFDFIYNNDGTISIKVDEFFLSARANGNMSIMGHPKIWERFFI